MLEMRWSYDEAGKYGIEEVLLLGGEAENANGPSRSLAKQSTVHP